MNKNELKERVLAAIEENKATIITAGRKIYSNPEFGYKEFETTKTVSEFFKNELGLEVEDKIAYTGCRARINEDKNGPKVAILGELDGISCSEHPDANSIGASHTCGHNVQIAGMLGAAVGLIKSGVFKDLDGKIDFIATPAEEFIELAYRSKLKAEGHIKYFGGKQELIRKGAFDDVDMSIMFHVLDTGDKKVLVGPESNGFIGKEIKFIGKEAHAGSAPYEGINALNAAMLAINNVNAQRETFKEADRVRFHPIITKGGDIVNVVPADVRMESYVRARTIDSMIDANKKVNRALIAGAMAVGAEIEITELPGYLPILKHDDMENVLRENLHYIGLTDEDIIDGGDFTGSFDFGDVSHIIPTLHPMFGGVKGALHTRGYSIVDEEYAYLAPAKSMALTVVDLLFDEAKTGKEILKNFKPVMTKEEYLAFMESNDKTIKA
ncbi:amidohydrolase [Fusobacterium ulcerans]|uniref:Peptidase M20 domain-containing protein 2 n=1 Tax=Fusobacterium ulcerans TaxID=861 RepID=A0AAX2JC04_9FUSO|nr:amidohydrolase [Fusobacterium ulcerans]AVQ26601.1 amidohydrolase [Fusobacterium ulcerans]EFS25281.1 amidohydrolase [Fusobacterium ulcerans ATCC 49185]SQJ05667.1 N-acyl-L-amino acid amidohydrolase [Fusobacterium ulcerans]